MTSAKMYVSTDVVERLTRSGCRPSAESERGFDGAGVYKIIHTHTCYDIGYMSCLRHLNSFSSSSFCKFLSSSSPLILYLFPAVSIHCHHSEGYRGEGDRAPIDAAFFMENQGVSSSNCKDMSPTHSLSISQSLAFCSPFSLTIFIIVMLNDSYIYSVFKSLCINSL